MSIPLVVKEEGPGMNGYQAQDQGQNTEQQVRECIEAMMRGEKPDALPYFGEYDQEMKELARKYDDAGCHARHQQADYVIVGCLKSGKFPKLAHLLNNEQKPAAILQEILETSNYPPLPEYAQLPQNASQGACELLDQHWIPWSRTWSPRGYAHYHEMTGIFLLSALALGRVQMNEGGIRSTNLYCLLAGRTGQYAKSTTAELVRFTLETINLDWTLCDDDATPQKFLTDMTLNVATNYEDMDEYARHLEELRLEFAGQRAWIYDEFGSKIDAIARQGGFMAEYRKILRTFDSSPKQYKNATQGRGREIIEHPYLSLLGSLTPKDVRTHATSDATMWGDGFLARFLICCPPMQMPPLDQDRPRIPMELPAEIRTALFQWHQQLGAHPATVSIETENKKIRYAVIPPQSSILYCHWTDEAYAAYKRYERALRNICLESKNDDLDGNYTRLPEYGIRVAMLFAALNNNGIIELRHWARAQEFIEHCREGLHHFYAQVNIHQESAEKQREDAILRILQKLGKASPRDIARLTNKGTAEVRKHLEDLKRAGVIDSTTEKAANNKEIILYFSP